MIEADDTESGPDPGEPPHADHGVNADRDLTLDPERADEPHRVGDKEPPRIRDAWMNDDDPLVAEETAAAAREARALGGRAPIDPDPDPAMAPVRQAGGGEAEGFEEAEDELIDNAEHNDLAPDPYNQAFRGEAESDLSSAAYGEADHEHTTELEDDGERDPDAEV